MMNCIEENKEAYLKFHEYKVNIAIQRLLDIGHDDSEEHKEETNIESHID